MSHFMVQIAVPVMGTLWAVSLGVMAARQRTLAGRIVFGALALAGAVLAAAGWYLLVTKVAE